MNDPTRIQYGNIFSVYTPTTVIIPLMNHSWGVVRFTATGIGSYFILHIIWPYQNSCEILSAALRRYFLLLPFDDWVHFLLCGRLTVDFHLLCLWIYGYRINNGIVVCMRPALTSSTFTITMLFCDILQYIAMHCGLDMHWIVTLAWIVVLWYAVGKAPLCHENQSESAQKNKRKKKKDGTEGNTYTTPMAKCRGEGAFACLPNFRMWAATIDSRTNDQRIRCRLHATRAGRRPPSKHRRRKNLQSWRNGPRQTPIPCHRLFRPKSQSWEPHCRPQLSTTFKLIWLAKKARMGAKLLGKSMTLLSKRTQGSAFRPLFHPIALCVANTKTCQWKRPKSVKKISKQGCKRKGKHTRPRAAARRNYQATTCS